MTARSLAVLALLAASSAPALAGDPCAGIDTTLTDARRAAYAPIVAGTTAAHVKAADVTVGHYLAGGGWIVVGAFVPVADGEGYSFFERVDDKLHFRDVWGGVAERSEAGEVAAWAQGLGAPAGLSRCFASTVAVTD